MPTLVYSAQNSKLQGLGKDKGRSKSRKCLVWETNCDAKRETSLSISFQRDSLMAGEQEPEPGAGGEENQADVSLLQVLEALLGRRTKNQAGRARRWRGFTGL